MANYQLNYAPQEANTSGSQRPNRSDWRATMAWAMGFLLFGLAFFTLVGTAFKDRIAPLSLRQQYDQLALKYDSLYAVKLNADKKIARLQAELQHERALLQTVKKTKLTGE